MLRSLFSVYCKLRPLPTVVCRTEEILGRVSSFSLLDELIGVTCGSIGLTV